MAWGALLAAFGCDDASKPGKASEAGTEGSAAPTQALAASAVPVPTGTPLPREQVVKVVNARGLAPYSGPAGTIRGTVVASGDEPPLRDEVLEEIPDDCLGAKDQYGRLFREGMMRSLADVLVAVTNYEGYVPAKQDVEIVGAKGCAFDTRTVALTYGQRLEVQSKDGRAYVPELIGAKTQAQLVATPGGKPVALYPRKVGHYVLLDSMRTYARADVYVLKYATFDVTGLDGKFEIKGVPAGKVKVSALLPSTMGQTEQEVTVKPDEVTDVQLTISFDIHDYRVRPEAPGAAATDRSGAGSSAKDAKRIAEDARQGEAAGEKKKPTGAP